MTPAHQREREPRPSPGTGAPPRPAASAVSVFVALKHVAEALHRRPWQPAAAANPAERVPRKFIDGIAWKRVEDANERGPLVARAARRKAVGRSPGAQDQGGDIVDGRASVCPVVAVPFVLLLFVHCDVDKRIKRERTEALCVTLDLVVVIAVAEERLLFNFAA